MKKKIYTFIFLLPLLLISCEQVPIQAEPSWEEIENAEIDNMSVYELGQVGDRAMNTERYTKALKYFKAGAKRGGGDGFIRSRLGYMYENGLGVTQDYSEAVRYYKLAVRGNNIFAQSNLAFLYEKGLGVTQNYTEASRLYRLGADQGDADAQFNLGRMYENGYGVTQSDTEAFKYYKLGADKWIVKFLNKVGYMYFKGQGVKQNYKTAIMYYESAIYASLAANKKITLQLHASQGDIDALFNLGVMYEFGYGVAQSDTEAIKYYQFPADQGHAMAHDNLERIKNKE